MVGLKFWGGSQKTKSSSSTGENLKVDGNDDAKDEQPSNNTDDKPKKRSGRMKEVDPRPEDENTQNSRKEDGKQGDNNTEQKKEVADSDDNQKKQELTEDEKKEQEKLKKYQEKNQKDVMKAVTSDKSEASADTPSEVQKPGQSTPAHIENPVATEQEKATQSPLEAQRPSLDEETRRMIMEDEEILHGREDDLSLAREASHKHEPVLSEDDQHFLQEITTETDAPPLPPRRATMIADDGQMTEEEIAEEARKISLPSTPREEKTEAAVQGPAPKPQTWKDRWGQWAFVPMPTSGVSFAPPNLLRAYNYRRQQSPEDKNKKAQAEKQQISDEKDKSRTLAADDLQSAAAEVKAESEKPESSDEAKATVDKNTQDVGSILSSLNLSAINNRVVGISGDTQKLLESFNMVLKDVINGGPRAYEDLEKLLTDREPQLDKLFGTLPPFLQSLVKSIPIKMYAALAPQLAAAMAFERNGADANGMSTSSVDAAETSDVDEAQSTQKPADKTNKKKKKSLIPSLRSLIGEQGAVAAMLKSILNFLEMRFPALAFLTGANVLMSLSVFILLFVFYYCHKRGKETRLKRLAETPFTSTSNPQTLRIGPSLEELESDTFFEKEDRERAERAAEAAVAKGGAEREAESKAEGEKVDQVVQDATEVPLPAGKGESDDKVEALVREAEGKGENR